MKVHRKQLASGLYRRKFDVYLNSDTSQGPPGTGDDPGRLEGNLDSNWADEGPLTTINITNGITTGDTHVVSGVFLPNETGNWDFRLRCDDAGYMWIGFNAEDLEWDLTRETATIQEGGSHAPSNGDATISLTAGVYYAIKIMVGDRGGGDAFIFDFKGPSEGSLSDTARDGTGFFFHNPYAPNGYNLDS